MNERIITLAAEAGFNRGDMERWDVTPLFEKFAELIVRECAQLARNTNLEDVEGGDSAVLRAAGDQIEDYFGVD